MREGRLSKAQDIRGAVGRSAKAFEDKTRDPNNELIVKLSEKSFFSKRRNARGKYVKIDPDAQDGIQLRTMKLR